MGLVKLQLPLPNFICCGMLQRTLPAGFIAPCLPTKTDKLPSGGLWLHEIKHDGFGVIARKNGAQVRLYSRPGNDLTRRFPLIVETLARLRSRSCIIDGEAVACDDNGVASFDPVRHHRPTGPHPATPASASNGPPTLSRAIRLSPERPRSHPAW